MMSMEANTATRPTSGATLDEIATQLKQVRQRTLALTEDLSHAELLGPMLPIVNPVLWEIGHVGWFHEFWTLRHQHGLPPLIARGDRLWDSSNVAHDTRWDLDLPDRDRVFSYLALVLQGQLEQLAKGIDRAATYYYELSLAHEDMHCEALTYMRQTWGYRQPEALCKAPAQRFGALPGDAAIPAGTWQLGSQPTDGFVFDNEKWSHAVPLTPYSIARAPVTNAQFAAFVDDDGYRRRQLWTEQGWQWRTQVGAERPVYWQSKSDDGWTWRRYDRIEALAADAPVGFVNWYEADAWCRWAGRRLPTEAEWEAAAIGEPTVDRQSLADVKRRWPWGDASPSAAHANIDHVAQGTIDVSACPAGDSAFGCRQMIGNVWEWTATDFLPFDGFSPDPYADYSCPWFGTRKVLRGGAWATHARLANPRYRNFFTPDRRDVIAGFRTCAVHDFE